MIKIQSIPRDTVILQAFHPYLSEIIAIYRSGSQCLRENPKDYDYLVIVKNNDFIINHSEDILQIQDDLIYHDIDIQVHCIDDFTNILFYSWGYIISCVQHIYGEDILTNKWNVNDYYINIKERVETVYLATKFYINKRSSVIKEWKHLYTGMCILKNEQAYLSLKQQQAIDEIRQIGINRQYATEILEFYNITIYSSLGIFE